jgi:glycosyltransferase involved in cell wall biosynthesis
VRATAPAGVVIAIAEDAQDLVGPLPEEDEEALTAWYLGASERGLWHDHFLTQHMDVAKASTLLALAAMDAQEVLDPSSAAFSAQEARKPGRRLTVAIDATWLGPHETGAQVLTTAAITAMAADERVAAIYVVGIKELPSYARHLADLESVRIVAADEEIAQCDIVWYPNQIDGRSNIGDARALGRRVVTTYLDLIAYDIPRYHASPEAWGTYRALQRRIALSVDGITAISADVANRLLTEVPRLDPQRVQPLPLGLDHIVGASAPDAPDADLDATISALGGKRFVAVLGNDFQHKNRDFAIAVWQRVLQAGQACDLVLAGLHVKSSSSKVAEDALLSTHVDLRGAAHTVGHLSGKSRAWLLANAAAVLYPSSAEGFGLVPYEAAILGTPSTFADFGPLKEIAGITGLPKHWSVEAFATDLEQLLASDDAARQRVADLHLAIAEHSWQGFSTKLVDFFVRIAAQPTVLTSSVGGTAADTAALSAILSSRTWRATESLRKVRARLRRK